MLGVPSAIRFLLAALPLAAVMVGNECVDERRGVVALAWHAVYFPANTCAYARNSQHLSILLTVPHM